MLTVNRLPLINFGHFQGVNVNAWAYIFFHEIRNPLGADIRLFVFTAIFSPWGANPNASNLAGGNFLGEGCNAGPGPTSREGVFVISTHRVANDDYHNIRLILGN